MINPKLQSGINILPLMKSFLEYLCWVLVFFFFSVLRETPKPRRKSGKVKEEKEKQEIKVEVEVEVKEEENEIREDEEPPRKWVGSFY